MHFMDPKTTQGIKDVLSPKTVAKFKATQPTKYTPAAKVLPVRGISEQDKAKPKGISKADKTIPLKKLSDGR
jgi:hypothetical protein